MDLWRNLSRPFLGKIAVYQERKEKNDPCPRSQKFLAHF
jgi:hypothetical protein